MGQDKRTLDFLGLFVRRQQEIHACQDEMAVHIEALRKCQASWTIRPCGSVKGLRARGGFELDVQWKGSKLANVTVRSLAGGSCRLRYGAVMRDLSLAKGQSAQWDGIK